MALTKTQSDLAAEMMAQDPGKWGDGTFLRILLENLPAILALIMTLFEQVPVPPPTPTPTPEPGPIA